VTGHLVPITSDLATSRRFWRRALEVRARGGNEPADFPQAFEERILSGSVQTRLYLVEGLAAGLVSWSTAGPLGVPVQLLYAATESSEPGAYAHLLAAAQSEAGPVAFVSGPLAGLEPDVEGRVMRALGFRRYGRTEMVLTPDGGWAGAVTEGPERLRPVGRPDLSRLAELHRSAYHDRFDRYLFLERQDETEDALVAVGELFDGRWGAFSESGSWAAERGGRLVGAVLAVTTASGTLIADVMVDPADQGAGVGRRLLARACRSLRDSGVRRIYLNVTEGNEPALRLYRRLGFDRSLGPTRDWYNAGAIPVPPSGEA